jgi:S1-C subfamily serine protease
MKKASIKIIIILTTLSIILLLYPGCKLLLPAASELDQPGPSSTEPADAGTVEVIEEPAEEIVKRSPIVTDEFLEALNDSVSSLVNAVLPSVVYISVLTDVQAQEGGVGSGVIYDGRGHIITNSHVAGNAEELLVTLSDGSNHPAELIGFSDLVDIAVIKIDTGGLTPANFASIDDQDVGEMVIAVGSPFGIAESVTLGIISGKGRNIPATTDTIPVVDLVQTDAAINPGNSGGPLINIRGEVIGINTLILSPSGASAGIGFSIPTDTATNIADQIIKYGRAVIPFIGVQMGQNISEIPGVLIAGTVDDSPAEKAGIKSGDILVKFGEKELKEPFDLLAQILRSNCNDVIQVEVYRNGEYVNLALELLECPVE